MPKINVYLPDDLAEAVREAGVPVSAVCQRALEQAVRRMTAIRAAVLGDVDADSLAARLPNFTRRAVTALSLAAGDAAAGPNVTTGHLLRGVIAEGANLALRILATMEIDPAGLAAAPVPAEPGGGDGLRFSTAAGNALDLAVSEATAMGHNYVGCEHLLIGLAGEPDGGAGRALREAGAQPKAVRQAVTAALAGYTHLRAAAAAPGAAPANLPAAVRAELQPLVRRIERLEGLIRP